jgi:hypothetical protein
MGKSRHSQPTVSGCDEQCRDAGYSEALTGKRREPEATSEESTMETLLGALAFAAFVLAQVAAVVAVHAESERRQPHPFDATRLDPRARVIQDCGG